MNKKLPLNESYVVIKLDGSKKLGCDVLSGTTQGWVCLMIYFEFISSSELFATIGRDSIIQTTFMTNWEIGCKKLAWSNTRLKGTTSFILHYDDYAIIQIFFPKMFYVAKLK